VSSPSNLFLSPHPDDLVYSAFSALTEQSKVGLAVVFFNVSRFTRWGLLPKTFVSLARTCEEKIILARLQVKSSFVWLEDSSSRSYLIDREVIDSTLSSFRGPLQNLFCPLAVSGHADHLAVRNAAIDYWLKRDAKPRICFYEDLPYAAKMEEIEHEIGRCVRQLSRSCGRLSVCYNPLNADQFKRKLFFSRLYLTQNDHTRLLTKHAEELGKRCGGAYAERYVCSLHTK
jgi:LmbE family N-acetylglucosaminyl deacetylase